MIWTTTWFKALSYTVIFFLGLGLGVLILSARTTTLADESTGMQPLREQGHDYTFIDPLLTCVFPESVEDEYVELEEAVQKQIDQFYLSGMISKISYYFRDLDSSHWVGINENQGFEPASLFKVPVMMAYYVSAESDPEILDDKITFLPAFNVADGSKFLKMGDDYSVAELIDLMITESDNVALAMLLSRVDDQVLREIFTDLALPYPENDLAEPYTISPRQYSRFFRVLYNGTYLSPVYSEKALELMSRATFANGLTSTLPQGTVISHKFGENILYDDKGEPDSYDLHDCGIVYAGGHPYFLCIFTEGPNSTSLTDTLGQLSETTYDQMSHLYSVTK